MVKMEIKDIVNDCIRKVDSIKSEEEKQRQETINQLLKLRRKTIKLIDSANKTLSKRQSELHEINEGICQMQGHNYTDWEEHEGILDRSWYYTRECTICGKKEQVDTMPKDFKVKKLK